jgi:hypothetical protein
MAVNPMDMFKIKGIWDRFCAAHPKLVPFFRTVRTQAIGEGTIIDIKVTDPNGKTFHYNLKLTQEDINDLAEVRGLITSMNPMQ